MKNGGSTSALPTCNEGATAFSRFDRTMTKLLSVSHAELLRREEEYRRKSQQNPRRRGPKRKVKPSTSAPTSESTA